MMLPNFFLAGAPKAGTTSLYHYLDQHPQIYMSPIKEPCFFAAELREENCDAEGRRRIQADAPSLRKYLDGPMREHRFGGFVTREEDYRKLFANSNGELAIGEASVCYLWSPTAPERIFTSVPNAKIVVMLRNPADRAFSQYLQGVGNGAIHWSMREHITRNLRHQGGHLSIEYPFLEFGLYAEQLARYYARFGRENVWVGFHEDFEAWPGLLLESLYQFLGVDPDFLRPAKRTELAAQVPRIPGVGWLKRSGLWKRAADLMPAGLRPWIRRALIRRPGSTRLSETDREFLIDYYRADIRQLEILLDRGLERWLDSGALKNKRPACSC